MFILIEFYRFMNITTIKHKLKRIGYFIPFNFRFILLLLALLWAATWLIKNNALLEEIITVTKDKADTIRAVVSIKEFDKKRALYDQAKKVSGIS